MIPIRDCKIQADSFWNYACKYTDKDLLIIFDNWAASKDFCNKDKQAIWKLVESYQQDKNHGRKKQNRLGKHKNKNCIR